MHPADALILALIQMPQHEAFQALYMWARENWRDLAHPSIHWYMRENADDLINWCTETGIARVSR